MASQPRKEARARKVARQLANERELDRETWGDEADGAELPLPRHGALSASDAVLGSQPAAPTEASGRATPRVINASDAEAPDERFGPSWVMSQRTAQQKKSPVGYWDMESTRRKRGHEEAAGRYEKEKRIAEVPSEKELRKRQRKANEMRKMCATRNNSTCRIRSLTFLALARRGGKDKPVEISDSD